MYWKRENGGFISPLPLKLSPELRTSWENLLKILLLFLKAITFIYLWGERVVACAMAPVCGPEDDLWDLVLSFHPEGSGFELRSSSLKVGTFIC